MTKDNTLSLPAFLPDGSDFTVQGLKAVKSSFRCCFGLVSSESRPRYELEAGGIS